MRLRWRARVAWNSDPGGAGGGGAGGGGGGAGGGGQSPLGQAAAAAAGGGQNGPQGQGQQGQGQQQPQQQQQQQQQQADWFPKGLDEKLKGKDPAETLANLAKHIGEQPKPPADAKAYDWKPSETLAPYLGDAKDSKVVDAFRGVALKHGLHQGQFAGIINDFYGSLIEQGLIDKPVDMQAELKALAPNAAGDPKAQVQAGAQRFEELRGWIDGLAGRQLLTKTEATALLEGLGSAQQVIAMEKVLEKAYGAKPKGPAGGGQPSDGLTEHERALRAMYPTHFKAA